MSFTIDQQSLGDLNIPGKHRTGSLYSLFNRTKTEGGEKLLERLFREPLADAGAINARRATFRYFQSLGLALPFTSEDLLGVEQYLGQQAGGTGLAAWDVLQRKALQLTLRSEQYDRLVAGLQACFGLIRGLQGLLQAWDAAERRVADSVDRKDTNHRELTELLAHGQLNRLLEAQRSQTSPSPTIGWAIRHHGFFGNRFRAELQRLLDIAYALDVYIAVSAVAEEKGFGYAEAGDAGAGDTMHLRATGLRHPALAKAVANDLALDTRHNVLFLTGANMAGKSTLMTSIGTNLYLAHLGFPVAAETLAFSVMEGIYSSINVPDNIQQGYSHFYAEVLRVRDVAADVGSGKRLLVLFDELFKGTNVQDAYEATLAVVEAFARHRRCLFVVSTHIIEVGDALKTRVENMHFRYLPTVMEGRRPRYTYRLAEGITADRQGMLIIENEKILEIINGGDNE